MKGHSQWIQIDGLRRPGAPKNRNGTRSTMRIFRCEGQASRDFYSL